MKILGVGGEELKACAQFQFQGWTVSASKILKGSSVMAWNEFNNDEIEGCTVEYVINEIIMRGLRSKEKNSFTCKVK